MSKDSEIERDFGQGEASQGTQEVSGTITREEALKIVLERVEGGHRAGCAYGTGKG